MKIVAERIFYYIYLFIQANTHKNTNILISLVDGV